MRRQFQKKEQREVRLISFFGSMGKWSNLPVDLLYAIEEHLVLYIDKVRIRTVSLEWNSYLPKLPDHRAMQTPLLLHQIDDDQEATHGLFNPLDNTIYRIYLPEAHVKIYKGSSFGWIITVEDFHSTSHIDICLINPVTRAQIKLPPRTEFPDIVRYCPDKPRQEFIIRSDLDINDNDYDSDDDYIDELTMSRSSMSYGMILKVVLSRPPNHKECVAIATYGQRGQLAWCKINEKDRRWTHIYTGLYNFIDILYSKNCLYALCEGFQEGQVFMFENIGTDLDIKFKEITRDRIPVPIPRSAYLADCSDGSLIVVVRHFSYDEDKESLLTRTKEFKVYKLSHEVVKKQKQTSKSISLFGKWPCSDSDLSWVEQKSIGDDVLFVGFGSVRSIPASSFVGCKRNHIYFTDSDSLRGTFEDNKKEKSDVGVFNLEDGSMELLPGLSNFIWPRPIWTYIC